MTASFTIRATELFCWAARAASLPWSPGSNRECIGMGAGFSRGRRIMRHYDSF